jgi:hypothetical protein
LKEVFFSCRNRQGAGFTNALQHNANFDIIPDRLVLNAAWLFDSAIPAIAVASS